MVAPAHLQLDWLSLYPFFSIMAFQLKSQASHPLKNPQTALSLSPDQVFSVQFDLSANFRDNVLCFIGFQHRFVEHYSYCGPSYSLHFEAIALRCKLFYFSPPCWSFRSDFQDSGFIGLESHPVNYLFDHNANQNLTDLDYDSSPYVYALIGYSQARDLVKHSWLYGLPVKIQLCAP